MPQNKYIIDGKRVSADEYNKLRYEDLRVRVLKGYKAEIRSAAAAAGQSLQGYILQAVRERIERENPTSKSETEPPEQT